MLLLVMNYFFVIIIGIIIELIKFFSVSEFKISGRCLSWCGHSVDPTCNLHIKMYNKVVWNAGAQLY